MEVLERGVRLVESPILAAPELELGTEVGVLFEMELTDVVEDDERLVVGLLPTFVDSGEVDTTDDPETGDKLPVGGWAVEDEELEMVNVVVMELVVALATLDGTEMDEVSLGTGDEKLPDISVSVKKGEYWV